MARGAYDAIIVGARCAGASLAIRLARAGLRVLVLEASRLPSDQTRSTHLIQHAGMELLDDLGLGDRVRELAPAIRTYRFGWEEISVSCVVGDARAARCLRREKLDGLLQDAARRAGAELRDGCRATGLVGDGQVSGVDVRTDRGTERLAARIVVGADGLRSTVAGLVGAAEYAGYDAPRAAYWAYWPRPRAWSPDELYQGYEGDALRFALPADGDLLLVGTAPRLPEARAWRGNHAAAYLRDVRAARALAPLLEDIRPASDVRGVTGLRYFFRVPAGPGWALVGDAGHHKDFVVARGITDALRDAGALADAVTDGREVAFMRYWHRRDLGSIGSYRTGEDLGKAGGRSRLERMIFAGLAGRPELARRLVDVALQRHPRYLVLPAAPVLRWLGAAILRGDVGVLGELPRRLIQVLRVRRDEQRCRRRLGALETA